MPGAAVPIWESNCDQWKYKNLYAHKWIEWKSKLFFCCHSFYEYKHTIVSLFVLKFVICVIELFTNRQWTAYIVLICIHSVLCCVEKKEKQIESENRCPFEEHEWFAIGRLRVQSKWYRSVFKWKFKFVLCVTVWISYFSSISTETTSSECDKEFYNDVNFNCWIMYATVRCKFNGRR